MNKEDNYIYEEITLAELAERFIGIDDFTNPEIYDISKLGIEIASIDENGNNVYNPVSNFVVKESVDKFYTDGEINVTSNHKFVENGNEILAKEHPDFRVINKPMKVVDLEVDSDDHTYFANGRLNHNTTSGGKAIAFHSSVRLRLKSIGQIKAKLDGVQQVIGIKTRVQVIKNRLGPPLKSIDYDIYFDSGIDNYGGWLTILKDYKLISQAGAWYTYTRESGEEVKFQSKDFASKLIEDPDLKDEIYKKICDAYIVNYKANEDFGIDDIEVDSEFVNEEG